jgi:hypothetical protein
VRPTSSDRNQTRTSCAVASAMSSASPASGADSPAHTSQSTVAASTVNTGDGPPIRRTWITVSDCKSAGRSVDTRADPNRADGTVAAVVNSSVTGGYTRRQRA